MLILHISQTAPRGSRCQEQVARFIEQPNQTHQTHARRARSLVAVAVVDVFAPIHVAGARILVAAADGADAHHMTPLAE